MKAAVVTDYAIPPQYQDFEEPHAHGADDLIVDVLAAALSPRVRSQAAGSHYSSEGELPLIPGIDGVGRTASGELRYFLLPDGNRGAMAERTVVDVRRSIRLPTGVDPVQIAAAMNPVMSSWVALRRRIEFRRGQKAMVLGAEGNAGRLAIQVALHLGASEVIGVGRDGTGSRYSRGSASSIEQGIPLDVAGSGVDVVLDYLWGQPTADALRTIVPARAKDSQPLTWVQIGSVAALESPIPSAALRAINLRIVGSGQGSVDPGDIKDELVRIVRAVSKGTFEVAASPIPLREVESAWSQPSDGKRIVLVPGR